MLHRPSGSNWRNSSLTKWWHCKCISHLKYATASHFFDAIQLADTKNIFQFVLCDMFDATWWFSLTEVYSRHSISVASQRRRQPQSCCISFVDSVRCVRFTRCNWINYANGKAIAAPSPNANHNFAVSKFFFNFFLSLPLFRSYIYPRHDRDSSKFMNASLNHILCLLNWVKWGDGKWWMVYATPLVDGNYGGVSVFI